MDFHASKFSPGCRHTKLPNPPLYKLVPIRCTKPLIRRPLQLVKRSEKHFRNFSGRNAVRRVNGVLVNCRIRRGVRLVDFVKLKAILLPQGCPLKKSRLVEGAAIVGKVMVKEMSTGKPPTPVEATVTSCSSPVKLVFININLL